MISGAHRGVGDVQGDWGPSGGVRVHWGLAGNVDTEASRGIGA